MKQIRQIFSGAFPALPLLILLLCLGCSLPVMAQPTEYADTTFDPPDVQLEEIRSDTEEEPAEIETIEEEVLPPSLRQVSDSTVARFKKRKEFAYANDSAYWTSRKHPEVKKGRKKEYNPPSFPGINVAFSTIGYTLLIVLILFVIYRIIVVNKLFLSTPAQLEEDAVPEVLLEEDELDKQVNAAVVAQNYRVAIRLLYLKSLRQLSDKGRIRYHSQSTNADYLRQLQQHPAAGEFRFLTQAYEYVWYGEFLLSEEQFSQLRQHFQQFYKSI
ncbi:MAG: DUF4129 domain-containing protein [Candidatus Pseudobacter hemicellulosilyticus]|uniref:DUF4129 domain-containing protein n=1 Tax=Candidatus Pseudobacter hemicellulosilyticus TaxID=3121375 RepID=A0AAJ5WPQ0_9BACT|nr:MAG: DUF4129 domain-containing protein [Pseudobacter sp.]